MLHGHFNRPRAFDLLRTLRLRLLHRALLELPLWLLLRLLLWFHRPLLLLLLLLLGPLKAVRATGTDTLVVDVAVVVVESAIRRTLRQRRLGSHQRCGHGTRRLLLWRWLLLLLWLLWLLLILLLTLTAPTALALAAPWHAVIVVAATDLRRVPHVGSGARLGLHRYKLAARGCCCGCERRPWRADTVGR